MLSRGALKLGSSFAFSIDVFVLICRPRELRRADAVFGVSVMDVQEPFLIRKLESAEKTWEDLSVRLLLLLVIVANRRTLVCGGNP